MDHISELKKSMDEMTLLFTTKMASFEESLSSPQQQKADTGVLASEFYAFKSFIWQAILGLKAQMELVFKTLDNFEMKDRANVLLLHGVPEKDNEELSPFIHKLCIDSLALTEISPQSLENCMRLGKKIDPSKPRPILLRFSSLKSRNQVWGAKKNLKGSGFTISEFLTSARRSVFVAARKELGVNRSWTNNGKIVLVGATGIRKTVTTMPELRSFLDSTKSDVILQPQTGTSSAPVSKPLQVPLSGHQSKPRSARSAKTAAPKTK